MGRFAEAADEAAALTNAQLATEIAALGTLTRQSVQDLLPERRDKEAFLQLMSLVESEKTEDEKLAVLRQNLETAGRVVLKILAVLV